MDVELFHIKTVLGSLACQLHDMRVTASIATFPRVFECICVTGARSELGGKSALLCLFPNTLTRNDLYHRVEVLSPSLTDEQLLREKKTEFSRAGQRSSGVMEQR